MKHIAISFLLLIATIQLAGCARFGRGIAEAYLDKQQSADTRLCEIWGKPFNGLAPFLDNKLGKMKVRWYTV